METQLCIVDGQPCPERLEVIKNRGAGWVKPQGGMWTSTYLPKAAYGSDWGRYCVRDTDQEGRFAIYTLRWWLLEPLPGARIVTIDTLEDLRKLGNRYVLARTSYSYFLDFEAISQDYDAMHLTEAGQVRTRLTYPDNLYGWDCESTLWFRWCFSAEAKEIAVPAAMLTA